jgi:enolase
METMKLAHEAGWATMPSERSGEAEESVIADLSVASLSGQIKRQAVVKYNRLLRIAEELGDSIEYAGLRSFHTWTQ